MIYCCYIVRRLFSRKGAERCARKDGIAKIAFFAAERANAKKPCRNIRLAKNEEKSGKPSRIKGLRTSGGIQRL